jgi:hypothetical protein
MMPLLYRIIPILATTDKSLTTYDPALIRGRARLLGSLKRQKRIVAWYDRNIPPGAEWASEIDAHLKTADIILLLIVPVSMGKAGVT